MKPLAKMDYERLLFAGDAFADAGSGFLRLNIALAVLIAFSAGCNVHVDLGNLGGAPHTASG